MPFVDCATYLGRYLMYGDIHCTDFPCISYTFPFCLVPCYSVTLLPLLLCYLVTLLLCHLIALSPCYSVPFLPCYPLPLFPCYSVLKFLILVYFCITNHNFFSRIDEVFFGIKVVVEWFARQIGLRSE